MRNLPFVLILLLALTGATHAITWEFDTPGDRQGWSVVADEMPQAEPASDQGSVADGCWSISTPSPSLNLVSPIINHDSGLFDMVTIRFRAVAPTPFEGYLGLRWTNERNRGLPGWDAEQMEAASAGPVSEPLIPRFVIWQRPVTYTTDWQELRVTRLRSGPRTYTDGTQYEIIWADTLIDIRVDLGNASGAAPLAERVEIDRIVLTGTGELLQGELDPPGSEALRYYGSLFSDGTFVPLMPGGIWTLAPPRYSTAALGDINGDGLLDLVATAAMAAGDRWFYALGDGAGSFGTPVRPPPRRPNAEVWGQDLNGDGLTDLVFRLGYTCEVFLNTAATGTPSFEWAQTIDQYMALAVADADGDERPDLWLADYTDGAEAGVLGHNDGTGHMELRRVELPVPRPGALPYGMSAQRVGRQAVLGMVWGDMSAPHGGYDVVHVDSQGDVAQAHVGSDCDPDRLRHVGDLDGDGDVDLLVASEVLFALGSSCQGLRCQLAGDDGSWTEYPIDEEVQTVEWPLVTDLNGDGLMDVAFTDTTPRRIAVVVALGQPGAGPVIEGRYPISGGGGAVLADDLDGDGDADLVVLEKAIDGVGGVHVLLNRLADGVTAVAEESGGAVPAGFLLGAAFPNPFNPEVTVPFALAADLQHVRLVVYNVLGQPLRTLVDGPLAAGEHRVSWDGRDDQGRVVPSGVYFHRLEAGSWQVTGRCARVE